MYRVDIVMRFNDMSKRFYRMLNDTSVIKKDIKGQAARFVKDLAHQFKDCTCYCLYTNQNLYKNAKVYITLNIDVTK